MTSAWMPPLLALNLDDAGVWNRALSFSGEPVAIEASGVELTFVPIAAPAANTPVAIVELRRFGQPVLVNVCQFPFEELCGVELPLEDLNLLPSGLRDALYEGMISHICDLVWPQSQGHWRFKGSHPFEALMDESAKDAQWFELVITQNDMRRFRIEVQVSRHDAVRLAGRNSSYFESPPRSLFGRGIRVPADFTIGFITVTFQELGQLEPDSIIVMAWQEPETCRMRVEGILYTFVSTEDGWCCTGLEFIPETSQGGANSGTGDTGAMEDKPAKVQRTVFAQELHLTLVFEVGRRSIPLNELSCWREGALIDLDLPTVTEGMEVTIRANGDVIGSGDLVRIDDRIAVRLTRLVV